VVLLCCCDQELTSELKASLHSFRLADVTVAGVNEVIATQSDEARDHELSMGGYCPHYRPTTARVRCSMAGSYLPFVCLLLSAGSAIGRALPILQQDDVLLAPSQFATVITPDPHYEELM
jgi:hypothetical protein